VSAASLLVFQQYCARIIAERAATNKRSLLEREISFAGEETFFAGDHEKIGRHDPKSFELRSTLRLRSGQASRGRLSLLSFSLLFFAGDANPFFHLIEVLG
jgi:hypothetical protein